MFSYLHRMHPYVGQCILEEFFEVVESLGLSEDQVGLEKSPVVSKASILHTPSSSSLLAEDSTIPSTSALGNNYSTSSLLSSPANSEKRQAARSPTPAGSPTVKSPGGGGDAPLQPLGEGGDTPQLPVGEGGDAPQLPLGKGDEAPQQRLRVRKAERICPLCQKRCIEKNMKRHILTHNKPTFSTCDHCGKEIGRGDNMRRHRKRCPR